MKEEITEKSFVATCEQCNNLCICSFIKIKEDQDIYSPRKPKGCIFCDKKKGKWNKKEGDMKLIENPQGKPTYRCDECGFFCTVSCLKENLPSECIIWNPYYRNKEKKNIYLTNRIKKRYVEQNLPYHEEKFSFLDHLITPKWYFDGRYDIKIVQR